MEVILPAHPSGYLYAKLHELGFSRIRAMRDWEKAKLSPNVELTMLINSDDGKYVEDSALLVDVNGFKILDRNDCRLSEEYSRRVAPLDLLFTQFSGAHWYPVMWEYGLQERQQKVDLFKKNLKEKFYERKSWLQPKVTVPSAGPACFLDKEYFDFNFNSIFPDAFEFGFGKDDGIQVLTPGQSLTLPDMKVEGKFDDRAYHDKEAYLREYQRDRAPAIHSYLSGLASIEDEMLILRFSTYFQRLLTFDLAQRVKMLVCFNISGRKVYLDFENGLVSESPAREVNYEIRLDSTFLKLIMDNELLWEDFLLSMRFSVRRYSEIYNWPLFALLRFGYSNALMKIIEDGIRSTETIQVGDYEIQRYCPHSGQDLSEATIEGNVITCPRHLWSFDLETGACVSGGNLCLKTKKLVPAKIQ